MPWRSREPMEERIRFIGDYLRRIFNFTELCQRYGISRKTGYKWVDRYSEEGAKGLGDRCRCPENNPRRTPIHIEKAILEVRQKHPHWGAKKILKILERKIIKYDLQCRSTVCEISKRNGCVETPRKRRRRSNPGKPTTEAHEPNSLWA